MNLSPAVVALVPPTAVTVTSTVPVPAGAVAVIVVALLTAYELAAAEPKLTAVAPVKFVPLIVTRVPFGPELGLNPVTDGTGGGAALLDWGTATPEVSTSARATQAPRTSRVRVNTLIEAQAPSADRPVHTDASNPYSHTPPAPGKLPNWLPVRLGRPDRALLTGQQLNASLWEACVLRMGARRGKVRGLGSAAEVFLHQQRRRMLDDRRADGRLQHAASPSASEIRYFVLVDRAVPYLLARVRWPDVAQAIGAASPDWLDDLGLFDLPYDPSAVQVTFSQAASVAAGWGTRLRAEPAESVSSYMRRMPANWSDLSPSERRAWGIQFAPRGFLPGGHPRQPAAATSAVESVASERRQDVRVSLDGRAHIRWKDTTVAAGLVDLGAGGVRCVLPDASARVAAGMRFAAPFLIEAGPGASRICLDVTSRISWTRSDDAAKQFGVAFAELADDETEGVRRFLAVAARAQARR